MLLSICDCFSDKTVKQPIVIIIPAPTGGILY